METISWFVVQIIKLPMYKIIKNQILKIKKSFGNSSTEYGFTLPELLIVMTVMAGLAAIMMVSYPASQRRARDTRRISDIKQYQTAIELYANRQGSYAGLSGTTPSASCSTLGLTNCPNDPKGSPYVYEMSVTGTAYALWARLEQQPNAATQNYFVVCSNGKVGNCPSRPSAATCPGTCP